MSRDSHDNEAKVVLFLWECWLRRLHSIHQYDPRDIAIHIYNRKSTIEMLAHAYHLDLLTAMRKIPVWVIR